MTVLLQTILLQLQHQSWPPVKMLSQSLQLLLLLLLLLHMQREVLPRLQPQIQEELLRLLQPLCLFPLLLVSLLQLLLRQDLPLPQKLQMAQMTPLLMQTPVGQFCC